LSRPLIVPVLIIFSTSSVHLGNSTKQCRLCWNDYTMQGMLVQEESAGGAGTAKKCRWCWYGKKVQVVLVTDIAFAYPLKHNGPRN
jgi:hypothetical protein